MQGRAVPALADIIKAPEANSPMLVEGALDVLAALLRPATPEQAARVHAAASSHVMALTLRQDDAAILQSCSEYLRSAPWVPPPYCLPLFTAHGPWGKCTPWCPSQKPISLSAGTVLT